VVPLLAADLVERRSRPSYEMKGVEADERAGCTLCDHGADPLGRVAGEELELF